MDPPTTKLRSATCVDQIESFTEQKFTRSLSLSHNSSDSLLEERPGEEELAEEPKRGAPVDISLKDFMNRFSQRLPKKGRVCKGYHSMCDQATITTGDVFTFHFVRSRCVVRAQDKDGTHFTIPLNSTAFIGIVYNPNNRNLEEARRGFHFDTVADILALEKLPPFVRAKFSYNTSDGSEYCISQGEVFHLIGSVRHRNRQYLHAHSITRNCKKYLAADCPSGFSTAPDDIQLHLYELSTNCKLESLLPCHAVIYVNERSPVPLTDLSQELLYLTEYTTETSVISTGEEGDSHVIEMLDSLDIELQEMEMKPGEEEAMLKQAMRLYEEFNPQEIKYYMNKPPSSRVFETQTALYQCVTLEAHFKGLEMVRSPRLSEALLAAPVLSKRTELERQLTRDGCPMVDSSNFQFHYDSPQAAMLTYAAPNPSVYAVPTSNMTSSEMICALDQRVEALEEQQRRCTDQVMQDLKRISNEIARMNEIIRQLDEQNQKTRNMCGSLKELISKGLASSEDVSFVKPVMGRGSLSPEGTKLDVVEPEVGYDVIRKMDNGSLRLLSFQEHRYNGFDQSDEHQSGYEVMIPKGAVTALAAKAAPTSQEVRENRELLARLDPNEVIRILEHMGLNQYSSMFSSEQISGDILSECTEQMLQEELKITSKLHRMRLMKVISGSQSIRSLLVGNNRPGHP